MNDNKSRQGSYSSLKGIHRAIPIILFGVAVFCTLCFLISDIGEFGRAIRSLLFGLFADGAYFIPLLICLHAIFYPSDLANKRIVSRLVFSFVSLIMISSFCFAVQYWNTDLTFDIASYYNLGKSGVGGGAIGSTVAYVTVKIFGSVGMIVIALTILAIYVSYFFANGKRTWSGVFIGILKGIVMCCAFIEKMIKGLVKSVKRRNQRKKAEKHQRLNDELSNDEFFDVDNGMQSLSIDKLGIAQSRIVDGQTVTLHDKVFHKSSIPADEYFSAEPEVKTQSTEEATDTAKEQFVPKKRIIHTDFNMKGDFLRSTTNDAQESPKADIIIEKVDEPVTAKNVNFSYEKSADEVFTQDFDPFKMMMSDDLATKPSSKATSQGKVIQGFTYSEKLNELTEEDVERAKRVKEFEARKQMIINQAKQATPVKNNGEYSGVTKSVEFTESTDTVMGQPTKEDSSSFSLKIDKNPNEPVEEVKFSTPVYDTQKSDVDYRDTYYKSSYDTSYASTVYKPYSAEAQSRSVPVTESAPKADYSYTPKSEYTSKPQYENTAATFSNSQDGLVFEFGDDTNTQFSSGADSLFDSEYREEPTKSEVESVSLENSAPYVPHVDSIDIERTIITESEPEEELEFAEEDKFDSFTDEVDDDYSDEDEEYDEYSKPEIEGSEIEESEVPEADDVSDEVYEQVEIP